MRQATDCTTLMKTQHDPERQKNRQYRLSRFSQFCLLSLCAALNIQPASAETFYKWKGDNGNWTYGTHPPAGAEATVVETTTGRNNPAPGSSKEAEQNETQAGPGEGAEYFATREPEVSKEEKNRLCNAAKSNLETLSSGAVIRRRDPDGSVTVISDEERKAEMDKARQTIKDFC